MIGLSGSTCLANKFDARGAAFYFDAGQQDASLDSRALALPLQLKYRPELGFGWTQNPTHAFLRKELSKSRNALTIDGVAGKRIAFRADVSPGEWGLTVWLDSAPSAQPSLRVLTQGLTRKLGWQRFTPPAEPRRSQPKTVRVFHSTATVGSAGFSLQLIGEDQQVRLLAIALIRIAQPSSPEQDKFLSRLKGAGSYGSDAELIPLVRQAEQAMLQSTTEAFYASWGERLALLVEAESLFTMRGWEWAKEKTGLGMFDRLYQAVMLTDALLASEDLDVNPLAERALFLRGRILYWLHRERAGDDERAGAMRDLGILRARHPNDPLLAMYVGEKVDQPDACDRLTAPANAPSWSVMQREALCRMRRICHWWVQHQQAENGEFGGKLGDDVELLRWWPPLVLAGDKIALEGWRKLADGVWHSQLVHDGYAAAISDVEHAAEFVTDTAPLMAIYSDDPLYQDRLVPTVKHFKSLWTGVTTQQHRFFRSAWFSSTAVESQPPKDRDLEYNTRAVQPIRYLAWRRPEPELVDLLHEWSLAWVDAALRTDKGKPKGIVPASIRFADESINGDESTWYQPNMYWKYFEWQHHAGSLMLDQLLFTYTLTHDEQLLQPLLLSLDLVRTQTLATPKHQLLPPGSPAWAAQKLSKTELFWQVVEQWRFLTGDSRWDDLIVRHGSPYARFRLSEEEKHLNDGLNSLIESVRFNAPLMTTEAIHTDRVYVPRAELLKAMLTGDGMKDNVSPYYAASWEETDEDFTALVTDTGADHLVVKLYSHAPRESQAVMRIWQLEPGEYLWRQELPSQIGESQVRSLRLENKGQRIIITIPAKEEMTLSLSRNRESATQ